jgi:hypothetical protein
MLTHEKKPGEAIALFAVEMGPRGSWLSPDVRKEMSHVARRLLQECLRPDTDVLLPNMDSATVRDLFFAVVYTQECGAEIISMRIRKQFESCEQLRPADLTLVVSHSFLPSVPRGQDRSREIFVEQVAARLQDRINTIRLQRSV